jgi:hypothetical protein
MTREEFSRERERFSRITKALASGSEVRRQDTR